MQSTEGKQKNDTRNPQHNTTQHNTTQHNTTQLKRSLNNAQQQLGFGKKVKLPTRDVLQVVTGRCLEKQGIDGFYKVLDAMTGRSNFTHELPAVAIQATPALINQFPVLKNSVESANKFFKKPVKSYEQVDNWLKKQIKIIGAKELKVRTIKVD